MRRDSYQQFIIVADENPEALTEKLNEKLRELKEKRPQVTFEGMIARICYTEEVRVCESLEDEYALKGVSLTCQDCPFFEPLLNKNGSVNRTAKRGDCQFAEYGTTSRDRLACERLFKMLNRGEIKLVKGVED